MPTITRNIKARDAGRPFLESIFQVAGTELATGDITTRAVKAGITCSPSCLMTIAREMVADGFLEQPNRGFFRRPDHNGTPLAFPQPVNGSDPLSPEATLLLRFAGLDGRLASIEKGVANLQASIDTLIKNLGGL